MKKVARNLALLLIALAVAVAPWAPALASSAPCTMHHCPDTPCAGVSAATCCCGGSDPPAASNHAAPDLISPTKVAGSFVSFPPDVPTVAAQTQLELAQLKSSSIPLFIRHESFLI